MDVTMIIVSTVMGSIGVSSAILGFLAEGKKLTVGDSTVALVCSCLYCCVLNFTAILHMYAATRHTSVWQRRVHLPAEPGARAGGQRRGPAATGPNHGLGGE